MTSQRTRIRRHADRAVLEEAAAILAQGVVAHVGFTQDQQPFVIPFAYSYNPAVPDRLYLHGAHGSRAMRHLSGGAPVCVTVTLLDGLVYSRTALFHSMNYRSVVCIGHARSITQAGEKKRLFEEMTLRYFADRKAGQDYEAPQPAHLRGVALIEVQIEEWSAKARRGGPLGPHDADPDAPGSAGVIELRTGMRETAY